jgi:hypothetical protein
VDYEVNDINNNNINNNNNNNIKAKTNYSLMSSSHNNANLLGYQPIS